RASRLPTVSMSHAVFMVSRRTISISIRASAIQSRMFSRVLTGAPKVSRSAARRHSNCSARSAAPTDRMQWWMRPGPSRACDHEAVALAREQVGLRHADVLEHDLGVALLVLVAEHRQPSQDVDAGGIDGHEDHALLPVLRAVRVRL